MSSGATGVSPVQPGGDARLSTGDKIHIQGLRGYTGFGSASAAARPKKRMKATTVGLHSTCQP
jgi:hypothetical protein